MKNLPFIAVALALAATPITGRAAFPAPLATRGLTFVAGVADVADAPPTLTAAAEVHTYHVRLDAYNVGTLVEQREVSFSAATEVEYRNAVGNAQAAFGRSLNQRGKAWTRISYRPLSID
jgi:hypothetical protein